MSAIDNTAYAAPRQSWIGALWADKARLRRILMIWGVGVFLAIAAIVYLTAGAMSPPTTPMSMPTS